MHRIRSKTLQIGSLALALGAAQLFGQTTPPGDTGDGSTPSTCSTAPTSITSLLLERTLNLNPPSGGITTTPPGGTTMPPGDTTTPPGGSNGSTGTGTPGPFAGTGLFTTLTPNVPANVLAAVTSGAVEVREQLSLNTKTKLLSVKAFTIAPGSPTPTSTGNLPGDSVLWTYQVQVSDTLFSCKPVPSVLIVGKIIDNFPVTPFGNAIGGLVAIGFGYTTDTPPALNNLTIMVPGIAGLYSASASGTLEFPTGSVNPPGTASDVPVVVFSPGPTQVTYSKQISLDASQSMDPNGLPLTFMWRQVNSNVQAAISNETTAMPIITFNGRGDYVFEVTVTNSKGVSSKAQTTITYAGI